MAAEELFRLGQERMRNPTKVPANAGVRVFNSSADALEAMVVSVSYTHLTLPTKA